MRLTYGEWSFYAFCVGMCFVNLHATLWIFIYPFVFARIVMMLGNWTQHSFIDAKDPEDNFTSAINVINTPYNHTCWNDGYHTVHHLRPAMHYTDIPAEFLKLKDTFSEKKTFIFDGIHYLHVFVYLMGKRYDKLADHLVNINGNTFASREEAIALMKERARKIIVPDPETGGVKVKVERREMAETTA
jgi:fatty acid desaturase